MVTSPSVESRSSTRRGPASAPFDAERPQPRDRARRVWSATARLSMSRLDHRAFAPIATARACAAPPWEFRVAGQSRMSVGCRRASSATSAASAGLDSRPKRRRNRVTWMYTPARGQLVASCGSPQGRQALDFATCRRSSHSTIRTLIPQDEFLDRVGACVMTGCAPEIFAAPSLARISDKSAVVRLSLALAGLPLKRCNAESRSGLGAVVGDEHLAVLVGDIGPIAVG